MTGAQQFVNSATRVANKKVFGNPKVSDQTAKRAYAIEQGATTQDAFKTFPNKTIQPKYHA